jgi:hypothetical protein
MLRIAIASALFATVFCSGAASAQTAQAKPKYPGEIAAASKHLAEKNEGCRRQAKRQKLSYLQRRRFIRDCVKNTP